MSDILHEFTFLGIWDLLVLQEYTTKKNECIVFLHMTNKCETRWLAHLTVWQTNMSFVFCPLWLLWPQTSFLSAFPLPIAHHPVCPNEYLSYHQQWLWRGFQYHWFHIQCHTRWPCSTGCAQFIFSGAFYRLVIFAFQEPFTHILIECSFTEQPGSHLVPQHHDFQSFPPGVAAAPVIPLTSTSGGDNSLCPPLILSHSTFMG